MDKKNKLIFNGFWDKKDCKFRVLEAIVAETPEKITAMYESNPENKGKRRYPWYEKFIGKQLQVIEVHANNIVWYINNSDGKGLKKVSNPVGKDEYGHKGLYISKIISVVAPGHWVKYSEEKELSLNDEVDNYFMKVEPFLYPKHKIEMDELREIIKNGGKVKDGSKNKKNNGDTTTITLN